MPLIIENCGCDFSVRNSVNFPIKRAFRQRHISRVFSFQWSEQSFHSETPLRSCCTNSSRHWADFCNMTSSFVPGGQQRYLRACMVCSIVQTQAVSLWCWSSIQVTAKVPLHSGFWKKDVQIVRRSSVYKIRRMLCKNAPLKYSKAWYHSQIPPQAGWHDGSGLTATWAESMLSKSSDLCQMISYRLSKNQEGNLSR